MSTVKITDLPTITNLDANTGNTILVGVDLSSDVTGRISATVLADGLYENKALKVGAPDILFSNVIAQFAGSGDPYLQVNAQNTDANNSMDYVATADIGTNANNFIDMGINNSLYDDPDFSAQKALDGYLYVHGSVDSSSDGNLVIGTASSGANVVFAVGGQRLANVVANISRYGLSLNGASYIKFSDNSIQSVAAAPANYTQSAFNTANSASANTIITQGVDATQNTNITSVNQFAQSAYNKANNALANTSGTFAGNLNVNGFITLNTAGGIYQETACPSIMTANTTGNFSIVTNKDVIPYNWSFNQVGTFTLPGEGVIRSNDDVITLQSFDTVNGIARGIYIGTNGGVYFNKGSDPVYLSLTDDSALISNNNTAIVTAISNVRIITDGINTARQFEFGSDGSLTIPNGLVVNNANTIVRDLNVNKNLTVNGTIVLANSNFSATEAALTIAATSTVALPSNDGYMLHISGKQNVSSRIVTDSYGANTYVVYAGRSARGTRLVPQAVANNDVLTRLSGNGYGTTGYAPLGVGRIDIVASQDHTDSARGTRIEMWNMPVNSNTLNRIATFNGESVVFSGVVNPEKGFVYTANTYPSSQTAINISFTDGPVYRAQTSAGLVATLSNFYAGKAVELWLTNTAGSTQTFTHGCSEINSTVNSTTYSIPGTSTIYAKYYCLDGTLANTFVAITHP
jgi:hypothetical protein